ncbi:MAG: hypothetical protein ACFFB0_15245 [Promethearchaeota archaeon]
MSNKGSTGIKHKKISFFSRINAKISGFFSKVKKKLKYIYDKLVHQEVYLEGQEPKFYSYQKKFIGLYGLFILYAFLLILEINIPGNLLTAILTFGNPFAFSNTIIAFFLILSILFSIDKVRIFIFEEKSAIKQFILYIGLIVIFYVIFLYIGTSINFTTYLLILSMIWLFLLSSRFYVYSRKFSTKIEARFIKKYSIPRYIGVLLTPFIILSVLVIISLFYRSFLVFLSLDFFSHFDPENAVKVYETEMRLVMPLIYLSLVATLLFIIFEIVFTRRRAETKRAGSFDNFTFSLIVFFIFFFQILEVSIFLFMRPETIASFKSTVGATESAVSFLFLFEFLISMFFLYRIVKKTGQSLGWQILIFKKDGLILFLLASVLAQTFTRYINITEIPNQTLSGVGQILSFDKYIISVLIICFLGLTILIYYLKPHETSMFIRMQKETVSEEEKSMEKIYSIIRGEYIRRGDAFPIEILERDLIKATQLSKAKVYSMIRQLAEKDMDIIITQRRDEFGKPIKVIDFTSVTERFEKKEVAEKKAKKYLQERLFKTATATTSRVSRLKTKGQSDKASDKFIESLTTNYRKKHIDEKKVEKVKEEAQVTETFKATLSEDLKNQIIEMVKKEYMYRIETPQKNPEFYIPVSEIINQLERNTKLPLGELFLILNEISKIDLEFTLIENPEEPEDKRIKLLPFSDDSMNYSLAHFRPDEYYAFKALVSKKFLRAIKSKKEKRIIFQLKKDIPNQTENQKAWLELLNILHKNYPLYTEQLEFIPNNAKMIKQIDSMVKVLKKK